MECIDILFRKNTKKYLFTVDALGKRKLYEYSVDILACIEAVDKSEKLFLGCFFGKCVLLRINSADLARLFLVVYVYSACTVITHYNYGKTDVNAVFL